MIVNTVKSAKYFTVLLCGKNGPGDLIRVIAVLAYDFQTYERKNVQNYTKWRVESSHSKEEFYYGKI